MLTQRPVACSRSLGEPSDWDGTIEGNMRYEDTSPTFKFIYTDSRKWLTESWVELKKSAPVHFHKEPQAQDFFSQK